MIFSSRLNMYMVFSKSICCTQCYGLASLFCNLLFISDLIINIRFSSLSIASEDNSTWALYFLRNVLSKNQHFEILFQMRESTAIDASFGITSIIRCLIFCPLAFALMSFSSLSMALSAKILCKVSKLPILFETKCKIFSLIM